jgi:hypothetical protein
MLPWFVRVQEDGSVLETADSGTWEELSAAHRDLAAPPCTPSGFSNNNNYGVIPYAFPAAVQLSGLGKVSDALVCRVR